MDKERFPFIEGLRGIAALVVVLAHCCSTFYPFFARVGKNSKEPWESILANTPAFLLVDGSTAVILFFLMSGFVLAGAFLHSDRTMWEMAVRRVIRLFIPVAASVTICYLAYLMVQPPKNAIAAITGSTWVSTFWPSSSFRRFLGDLLAGSLFVGYAKSSIFDGLIATSPLPGALNLPTWSLHTELWGSFMLILTAYSVRRYKAAWIGVALGILCLNTLYTAFLIGFMLYTYRGKLDRTWNAAGVACIYLGTVFTYKTWGTPVDELQWVIKQLSSIGAGWRTQNLAAAVLIFVGVMLSPMVRNAMSVRPLLSLGRLSFSLYLIHFPILVTLGAYVFLWAQPLGYGVAAGISTASTIVVALGAAALMERYVDRAAIRWSRFRPSEKTHAINA